MDCRRCWPTDGRGSSYLQDACDCPNVRPRACVRPECVWQHSVVSAERVLILTSELAGRHFEGVVLRPGWNLRKRSLPGSPPGADGAATIRKRRERDRDLGTETFWV